VAWPPETSDFYLADPPQHRAVFQGDVFRDVPFTRAGAGNGLDQPPAWSFKPRYVAALQHPCAMYGDDNVTMIKAQAVVAILNAKQIGLKIDPAWEGTIDVCPIPDLLGDGEMWVADFRQITTVDRAFLPVDRRARALSELGWAVFRQRMVTALTRAKPNLEDVRAVGRATWLEYEIETEAVGDGVDRKAFQSWLDSSWDNVAYATPRKALEADDDEPVRYELAQIA